MDITALGRLFGLAPLLLDAPSPKAGARAPAEDEVVLRGPVSADELREVAGLGMRSLAALLPSLERALQQGPAPAPVGHLARALGDAAHQVGVGLRASTDPGGILPLWREEAGRHLRDAAELLDRAGQLIASPEANAMPQLQDVAWAALQVAGAQRLVAGTARTLAALEAQASSPADSVRFSAGAVLPSLPPALRAAAFAGALALLLLLAVASGLGAAATVALASAAAVTWRWQILLGARPVRLTLRRSRERQ